MEVWVTQNGKRLFQIGARLVFNVKSQSHGYLYLMDATPDNSVTLLFKNYWGQDNFIQVDTTITAPNDNFRSEFIASEPIGVDTVMAIVSTKRWGELERIENSPNAMLAVLNGNQVRDVVVCVLTCNPLIEIKVRPKTTTNSQTHESANTWALGKIEVEIR